MAAEGLGIRIQVDKASRLRYIADELNLVESRADNEVRKLVVEAGNKLRNKTIEQTPIGVFNPLKAKFGNKSISNSLKRSFTGLRVTKVSTGGGIGYQAKFTNKKEYWEWVLDGTSPHTITAVNAPRLIYWSFKHGHVRKAISVEHPGAKPNDYFWRARAEISEEYGDKFYNVIGEVMFGKL